MVRTPFLSYNYRTFHTAILEKFPDFGFKSGFDWAEALYNAIINEYGYDYNLSLSEKTVTKGKEQANLIGIRLRTLFSSDVYRGAFFVFHYNFAA